jgi:catechol 2,3-dioxygenase-like lactoylglutathione lyase family enzyme
MPVVKVKDIAWARLRSPDLDKQEEFLLDFGMVRAARTKDKLFMRGTDPVHHLHVTELGPPGFIGLAYHASSEEDLDKLAKLPGASPVEATDEPGGGKRVRLREPNGYQIEVVWGLDKVDPLPVKAPVVNWGTEKLRRAGDLYRREAGPSMVKRVGHGVLTTPDLVGTLKWFRETLGFVCSDDVWAGDPNHLIGSFNRCDQGDDYVDHHVFFGIKSPKAGLNHVSFEVHDFDDVMMGHEYLEKKGKYEHMWGIGRHLLGSQVFDYWADPWGRVHEHWADSDVLNIHNASNSMPAHEAFQSQWGDAAPQKFIEHTSP